MVTITSRDPKDLVYAQIERAFEKIPIPRTTRSGTGWYFSNNEAPLMIGKIITYILSLDGVLLIDFNAPLFSIIFRALKKHARSASDSMRLAELQIEVSGNGDKLLYDIIERTIRTLTETYWRNGRYIKDNAAKKKFISRIIDELFSQKNCVIISATEGLTLIQEARRRNSSMQGQAQWLQNMFEKKQKKSTP